MLPCFTGRRPYSMRRCHAFAEYMPCASPPPPSRPLQSASSCTFTCSVLRLDARLEFLEIGPRRTFLGLVDSFASRSSAEPSSSRLRFRSHGGVVRCLLPSSLDDECRRSIRASPKSKRRRCGAPSAASSSGGGAAGGASGTPRWSRSAGEEQRTVSGVQGQLRSSSSALTTAANEGRQAKLCSQQRRRSEVTAAGEEGSGGRAACLATAKAASTGIQPEKGMSCVRSSYATREKE
mmetsp:Transcript_3219/g.7965  ORF Transcript_3219/g.7965 Transcript_3219/m.7965 type:complete len:236 (-) Transcript_3219:432-1139(-)